MTTIQGHVAPGFEPVRSAFQAAFEGRPDMGAAVAVRHNGEEVVSLWGGVADPRNGTPWTEDTASVIFSCTKGLVSVLIARLVEEGRLDYDELVARYWPEFAEAGKDRITIRQLLAHQAGLSAFTEPLSVDEMLDWDTVVARLARQRPLWSPAAGAYSYHAITHGWLAGEVIRRVTGKSIGGYFAELVANPLQAAAWIGLPATADVPVAHLRIDRRLIDYWAEHAARDTDEAPNWPYRAMTLGGALPAALITATTGFNDRRVQAAEIPGAGGIATARALAAIWSATVTPTDGVRLLSPETVAAGTAVVSEGAPVFEAPPPYARFGAGFQLDSEARRFLTPASFGHGGAGGQAAFADPHHRVGFAFITNWMEGDGDERAGAITDALREAIQTREAVATPS